MILIVCIYVLLWMIMFGIFHGFDEDEPLKSWLISLVIWGLWPVILLWLVILLLLDLEE